MSPASRKNQGLFILVHQGLSYAPVLVQLAADLGVEAYILSSRSGTPGMLSSIADKAAWVKELENDYLGAGDVESALAELAGLEKNVMGCIATMEGYRLLAARVNQAVGATDSPVSALRNALDKLQMRRILRGAGLSRVEAIQLDSENMLHSALRSGRQLFIKPRRGAASFGTFKLNDTVDYAKILQLQNSMKADKQVGCVFYGVYDFIMEDYIEGPEYSFEAIVFDSEAFLIASHEKTELEEGPDTVLEHCLVSPSLLSPDDLREARNYLNSVCDILGLTDGCFHFEMRRSPYAWEMIEINPRVGGSLVNDSVKVVTGGVSMLDLWVRLILAGNLSYVREHLHATLQDLDESLHPRPNGAASFMRLFFGKPGGTVKKVIVAENGPEPELHALHVKEGAYLPNSNREIFVGEALWKLGRSEIPERIREIEIQSRDFIRLEYD
jgi:biotin carboxylase